MAVTKVSYSLIMRCTLDVGVKENEILYKPIRYNNRFEPFELKNLPNAEAGELTIKDKRFEVQQEGRIIVNTKNQSIIDRLCSNPIEIGSLASCAKKLTITFMKELV